MLTQLQRRLVHTRLICLLANSQTADRVGAQLIADLKEAQGDAVQFIGAGGPLMQPHFSAPAFWSTDLFDPKPFVPFRGTVAEEYNWWLWLRGNPFTSRYTRPMREVLSLVKKTGLLDTIRRHRPATVVTIDHDLLSFKLLRGLAENYESTGVDRPRQLHIGHYIKNLKTAQLSYLDHVLYTMPIPSRNFNQFVYPSTYIGHQAFADAYRFLLSRHPDGQSRLQPDSVLMHREHFYSDTLKFIDAEKARFRKKFNIADDVTVLFFSPGNKENEFKWALPILLATANQFSAANKSSKLAVVIPTTDQSFKFVSSLVGSSTSFARLIVTETAEDKSSALAGSNYAICYNGEIVTECLVNQLPTVVIQNMKKMEFYAMYAWNRFTNEMNIVTDGEQYPEIIEGQCSPAKLVEVLSRMYRSRAEAFWPLEGFEPYLNRLLPCKARETGMGEFNLVYTPAKLAAATVWKHAETAPASPTPEADNLYVRNILGH